MNFPVDLLRIELLHPLTVHFPVAFLMGALAIQIASMLVTNANWFAKLRFSSKLLLFLGVCGAWAAVWSGGEAEEVVENLICAPKVIHEHEEWAERSAYMFSGAFLLWILLDKYNWLSRKAVNWAVCLLLLLSAMNLAYAAHLGGTLVYQQGAAVRRTSELGTSELGTGDRCSELKQEELNQAESK